MSIPAPILAEAREAFWTADTRAALEAALAVLSRHWPASDARLREAATELGDFAWSSVFTDHPDALANLRTLVGNLRAALSTPAPAESVRVVRVAVAENPSGTPFAEVIHDNDEDDAWSALLNRSLAPIRLGIGVMEFPIREVPTVQASVTGAKNG